MTKLMMMVLLGASLVAIAGCGGNNAGEARTTLVDVAQAAARGSDNVAVEDLARWLVEGRQDFVLVDVRPHGDFQQGSIGEARNLSIAELVTDEILATLPRDRRVIVYSNGSETGAKASVLLRLAGIDAHVLSGGYNAWHARVLNPDIPAEEVAGESLQVSEQRALACYFVGERSGEDVAKRPRIEFVPPVYMEDEQDEERLPPVAEESC
jgi:rhodanese-related sulfurtransferase